MPHPPLPPRQMDTNRKDLLLKNLGHLTETVTKKDHLKMVYMQLFYVSIVVKKKKKWLVNILIQLKSLDFI